MAPTGAQVIAAPSRRSSTLPTPRGGTNDASRDIIIRRRFQTQGEQMKAEAIRQAQDRSRRIRD